MNLQQNVCDYKNQTVREIFRKQDALKVRISIFVKDEKLVGVLSDGDIRRFILSGGDLDSPAINVATKTPITAKNSTEAAKIQSKRPNLKAIPIVDDDNRLLDIYCSKQPIFEELNIPVIINAGGKGTRLDPYTRVLPKPLIPIGDLPILEIIMKEYEKYKCNDFSVIVNYKGHMIKAYFSDNLNNYHITWIDETKPLGTGGGLSLLKGQIDKPFFFANCDTLIRTNYSCIVDQHNNEKNAVTIVSAYKNVRIPYGVIEIEDNGKVTNFREKPDFSFLTNTGMYLVEPYVLDEMQFEEYIDFPQVVDRLMHRGFKVGVYPISEIEWLDMGQMDELARMKEILLNEKESC